MEIVECSPPYDNAEITALLGVRVICDVLGTLVNNGHLPKRTGAPPEAPPQQA
jgi:agmatinase